MRGLGRLDGGDDLDQTACSPRRDRTSLQNSSQERNFLLQRPGGEMGSFGSIAGAETALTKEFGRHVFEIAALLRVSQTLYNYRVCVVEMIWTKLAAPHAVIEPVSDLIKLVARCPDSQELEPPLRSNHRQLPRHPPRQISGRRLAAV